MIIASECRLVLIEEYAKRSELDYYSIMTGPRLDEIPSHMVNTNEKLLRSADDLSLDSSESEPAEAGGGPARSQRLFKIGKRKSRGSLSGKSVSTFTNV